MHQSASFNEVTVWTDEASVDVVRQVCAQMKARLSVVGVGGQRAAAVDALAQQFHCQRQDDLRKLLVDRPTPFVWLLTMQDVPPRDLQEAIADGSIVLSVEPASTDFAAAGMDVKRYTGERGIFMLAPAFDHSPGWTSAADPVQVIGPVGLLGMTSTGTANRPSLFARLYDAWRLLLQFGGLPQSIDASLVPCHRRIPEDLRAISGHMAVHARLVGTTDSPCSITMELSDQSPVSVRQLRAIGHTGRLTVTDSSYRLHDAAGAQVDQKMEPDEPISFAQLIACQWIRLLDRPVYDTGDAPGPAEDAVTACCMACLLSAHTHQPESPQRLLEVHRRL